jgi:LmbE family N-acetylglucosaminyl deacetylase
MNPYKKFVTDIARLVGEGKTLPLGKAEPLPPPPFAPDAPNALFFSPHPDDECISGGLALRVMREAGYRTINVAVTQGSRKDRQAERWKELEAACNYIGFGLVATGPNGLEKVNAKTRANDPGHWAECLKVITGILSARKPRVIFFPHERDWNSAHIGTHLLVMDSLKQLPVEFECYLVETEFWGQMDDPNLMVEISPEDLTDLATATSFHVGEVERNPYHLLLPAWMMDNVRRGSELVGGQGGIAPDFTFAALYRLRKWKGGRVESVLSSGRHLSSLTNAGQLFT